MKRRILTASIALAFVVPSSATAQYIEVSFVHHVTTPGTKTYLRLYKRVAKKFGPRTPGRNIVRDGFANGKAVTSKDLKRSIVVFRRMLAPPPAPAQVTSVTTSSAPVATQTAYVAPSSSLMACIIRAESGGNPQATNGIYSGIGQWQQSTWVADGGTKYASTPTGASYSQQATVLASEGAAGMQSQQAQYDGC